MASLYQTCSQTVLTVVLNKTRPNSLNKEKEESSRKKKFHFLKKKKSTPKPFMQLDTKGSMKRSKNSDMTLMIWKTTGMRTSLELKQKSRLHTIEEWQMRMSSLMKKKHSQPLLQHSSLSKKHSKDTILTQS